MKKMDQKGFTLMETLIVSVFVTTLLVFLFIQFQKINDSYDVSFHYNTVNGLYGAESINEYIHQDGYNKLVSAYENNLLNGVHYVDITDCPSEYFDETTYCQQLMASLNIGHVYFTSNNVTDFLKDLEGQDVSEKTKAFVRYIHSDQDTSSYRLVIEYQTEEYATLKLGTQNLITYQYHYTGDYQTFTAPEDGLYRFETWGAQGGNDGGNGAYAAGLTYLNKGRIIYLYVGEKGKNNSMTPTFNGGGAGSGAKASDGGDKKDNAGGSGGGASDIRLMIGDNTTAHASRIMVAAGGGGSGGTNTKGGAGGTLVGLPKTTTGIADVTNGRNGVGGFKTSGGTGGMGSVDYKISTYIGNPGSILKGGDAVDMSSVKDVAGGAGGGGGGYYGGGAGGPGVYGAGGPGGGGSSFISGYPGCDAMGSGGSHTGLAIHYSSTVFSSAVMIDGENTMPNPNGTGMIKGKTGDGQINISYVSQFQT